MPEQNPFEPMEQNSSTGGGHPHDRGESTVDSGDLARAAAAAAVRGEQQKQGNTVAPGTQFQTRPEPQQDGQQDGQQQRQIEGDANSYTQFEQDDQQQQAQQGQQGQRDGQAQQQGQQDDTTPRQPGDWTPDEYAQLKEMGIDLPVEPSEVPEDFREGYSRLAEAVLDAEQQARERLMTAEDQIAQVNDLRQTLQSDEGQRRILLGLAMNNQDLFQETVDMVQRMSEDPQFADTVQRQIEADLKLKEAQRQQQALQNAQRATKGRQVENRTVRLARRLGVNEDLAKQMVVAKIRENQAQTGQLDISLDQVDEVVKSLAETTGSRPRAKSPQTQQREQQANTQRAQGTGQEPNQQQRQQAQGQQNRAPQPSDGGRGQNSLDRLRNAVRQSAQNVRAKGL